MKTADTFPSRLREARTARGMTQQQVAERLGLSPVSYGAWERGKTEPSIGSLVRLCAILGTSADWLVGVPDPPGAVKDIAAVRRDADAAAYAMRRLLASVEKLGLA